MTQDHTKVPLPNFILKAAVKLTRQGRQISQPPKSKTINTCLHEPNSLFLQSKRVSYLHPSFAFPTKLTGASKSKSSVRAMSGCRTQEDKSPRRRSILFRKSFIGVSPFSVPAVDDTTVKEVLRDLLRQ
jgi:hypothetical protein